MRALFETLELLYSWWYPTEEYFTHKNQKYILLRSEELIPILEDNEVLAKLHGAQKRKEEVHEIDIEELLKKNHIKRIL
jgi:hypothetical protein